MYLAVCMLGAYLYGNILFAIVVTKIATGKDIRKIGNTNPGTSNVFKNVGAVPGTIVFLLDFSKGLVPIIIARLLVFSGDTFSDWLFLYLIGMAAILGHTRPIWNRFKKGGGGMGSAIGVFAFFVPFEYIIAMIIGIFITYVFMKNAKYKMGRWVVMYAALVLPFIVLLTSRIDGFKLFAHIGFGGHSSGVVVGTFGMLLLLLVLNSYELVHWLKNPSSNKNPRRDGTV